MADFSKTQDVRMENRGIILVVGLAFWYQEETERQGRGCLKIGPNCPNKSVVIGKPASVPEASNQLRWAGLAGGPGRAGPVGPGWAGPGWHNILMPENDHPGTRMKPDEKSAHWFRAQRLPLGQHVRLCTQGPPMGNR